MTAVSGQRLDDGGSNGLRLLQSVDDAASGANEKSIIGLGFRVCVKFSMRDVTSMSIRWDTLRQTNSIS